MVPTIRSSAFTCEAMMQEIAEASVESIFTGIETPDCPCATPDTSLAFDTPTYTESWDSPFQRTLSTKNASWSYHSGDTTQHNHHANVKRSLSGSGLEYGAPFYSSSPTDEGETTATTFSSGGQPTCNTFLLNRSDSSISSHNTSSSPPVGITTVMLRNIPNKYTRSGLLSALIDKGFDPTMDCNNLYLPMDATSGCNLGYAFLNFTSHEKALEFMNQFDGVRLPSAGSRKVCTVVWANKQGLFQHSNPPTLEERHNQPVSNPYEIGGLPSPSTMFNDVIAKDTHNLLANPLIPFNSSVNPACPPTCKIFIGGLPNTVVETDLIEYFSRFGAIKEVSVVWNRQTGQSRGFGFCEFFTPDCVDRVQAAQTKKPHSIKCRVVSVRPYNFNSQFASDMDYDISAAQPSNNITPARVTFLMGEGGIIRFPHSDHDGGCMHPSSFVPGGIAAGSSYSFY